MKHFGYIMVLFLIGYALAYYAALPSLRRMIGPRYVASFAIIAFASIFAPNVYIFWAACMISVVATVRDRHEAICRYVMLLALVPSITIVLQVGGAYIGTYTPHIAILFATMAMIAFFPAGKAKPIPRLRAEDWVILTLYAIFFVAAPRFTSITEMGRSMAQGAAELLLPYFFIRRNVRTAEEAYRVIGCLVVVAMSIGVMALFEARRNWPLFDLPVLRLSQAQGVTTSGAIRGTSLRALVTLGNPLLLAFFMMVATIAVLSARAQFRKAPWWGCLGVIVLATIAPQSRGALIALVPGLIILFATQKKYGAAAAMLAASGLGGMALLLLRNSSERVASFLGQGQQFNGYYDYRSALFDRGVEEAIKHPIFGQPIDRVLAALQDMTQGERIVDPVNVYLFMVLIGGLVGFGVFAVFVTVTLRKLIARAKRTGGLEATRASRTFVLAALTATLVYIAFLSFAGRLETFIALLVALSRTVAASLIHLRPPVPAAAGRRVTEQSEAERADHPALAPA